MNERTYQGGYADKPGRCDGCLKCVVTPRPSGRRSFRCLVDRGRVVPCGCCNDFTRGEPLIETKEAAA